MPPNSGNPPQDPSPIVIDLLVNLAATALAGTAVQIGETRIARSRKGHAELAAPDLSHLNQVRDLLSDVERLSDRAAHLVPPTERRELGGVFLLSQNGIGEYRSIRDQIFEKLREIDVLTQKLADDAEGSVAKPRQARSRLTKTFREQVQLINKRLAIGRLCYRPRAGRPSCTEPKAQQGSDSRRLLVRVLLYSRTRVFLAHWSNTRT